MNGLQGQQSDPPPLAPVPLCRAAHSGTAAASTLYADQVALVRAQPAEAVQSQDMDALDWIHVDQCWTEFRCIPMRSCLPPHAGHAGHAGPRCMEAHRLEGFHTSTLSSRRGAVAALDP